jgi:hypothetical protein
MSTVWKAILVNDDTQIDVPVGSEFLYAREQDEEICVWYRCDPKQPKERRFLKVRGTGWNDATGKYLGSAHLSNGLLVFHVFETPP